MCRMLLSINPEYVKRIFNGSKKYEFRKTKCRNNVDSILIYETAPVMKVVGEATIKRIITGKPSDIWKKTKEGSGISKPFFDLYYGNRDYAVVYELDKVTKYEEPRSLVSYGILQAPQSFRYING